MGEWLATNHPSGVIQDRTRTLRAWLHDTWKLRRILKGLPPDPEPTIIYPESQAEFEAAVEGWTHFAYDLETDRTNHNFVHCMAVSDGDTAVVIDSILGGKLEWAQPLFLREGLRIVQNGAFDMPILRNHGIDFDWTQTFDTMLAAAVLSPDEPHSLAYIVSVYLDYWAWKYESDGNLARYNAEDAALTYRVAKAMVEELKEKSQWHYLMDDLMPVLWEIIIPLNETGVYIDKLKRKELLEAQAKRLKSWQQSLDSHFLKLSEAKGRTLSPPLGEKGGLSYQKVIRLLYTDLRLPIQRDPETNSPSTSKEALKKLKPKDPTGTVELLLQGSKLGETRAHLAGCRPGPDGRAHSRFILGGDEKHDSLQGAKGDRNSPRTGRLSSREPNLQNMHWSARYVIRATPGLCLLERDYSQIELRLNAYFSKDEGLAKALAAGDAHLYIAWLCDQVHGHYGIANYTWDECYARFQDGDPAIKKARKTQKTPTYGWFYRMGATKLWLAYDVPVKQGRTLLGGLNEAFPGVVRWWDRHVEEVRRNRYYQNPFGRRRYFFDWKEEVPAICNTPAQSTAADCLYRAMRTIQQRLRREVDHYVPEASLDHFSPRRALEDMRRAGWIGRLILTVHDQVLLEGFDRQAMNRVAKEAMDQPFPELDGMVIPSDAKAGICWGPKRHPDTGEVVDPDGMEDFEEIGGEKC